MWRMQIYGGAPPPKPWSEVRDQAAPAATRPGPAFRDAHAALAFAASGDKEAMDGLIARLRADAEKGNLLAREVTLPLAQGIDAFTQGDYSEATRLLGPLYPQLTRIGGSHAQREVFEDTLLEAYLRAEEFDQAEAMLSARLKQRASIRDTFWLARAQAGEGQAKAAQASAGQALQAWQQADPEMPELASLRSLTARAG